MLTSMFTYQVKQNGICLTTETVAVQLEIDLPFAELVATVSQLFQLWSSSRKDNVAKKLFIIISH